MREALQQVGIAANQHAGGLIDERTAHGRVAPHQTLVVGSECDEGHAPHNVSHIQARTAVHAGTVGSPHPNRQLEGGRPVIYCLGVVFEIFR